MTILLLLFKFGFLLFLFSFLIAMARISKTMLNKSDKSGQPCLIQVIRIFQVMLSVFTVENEMVFAMGLLHGLYYVAVGSLYVLFLESFFFFNHK